MASNLARYHNHLLAASRRRHRLDGLPSFSESRRDVKEMTVLPLYETEIGGRR